MNYESLNKVIEKPITGEWGSEGNNVKVLRTTNFTNEGRLNLNTVVTRNISGNKIESKKLKCGDTIIEKSGGSPNQPVGRVVYFDIKNETYLCNNFTSILRPQKNLFPKYLFYFLFSRHLYKATLAYQNKTTGIINLQLTRYLTETQIPLPSLPIQQKIADVLDKADAFRQANRQILEKYDQLAQSVFLEMFGDLVNNRKKLPIKEFGTIFKSLRYGVSTPPKYVSSGIPFIRATNIKNGGVKSDGMVYITTVEASKIKKCKVKESDIIVVRSGANSGDCCRIPYEYEDAYAGFDIIIEIDEPFSTFYNFLLNTGSGKAVLDPLTRRAGQPHLNAQQLTELKLIFPPLELQETFVSILKIIEQQKALAQQEHQKSEELFQGLLQRAFKGELFKEEDIDYIT